MYFRLTLLLMLLQIFTSAPARAQTASDAEVQQHFQTAEEASKAGDYAKAVAEYQTVLKLRPDLVAAQGNLGLVFYVQGKNDEAVNTLKRARKLQPDLLGANLFLGMAYVRTN